LTLVENPRFRGDIDGMLIDAAHKRWALVTGGLALLVLAGYGWLNNVTPGGLTGGSPVGLWLGIAGFALMVYAGMFSLLRKVPSWWWLGSRKVWLRGHIWLGLLSGVVILCHSGFRWGGALEQLLWIVLGITFLTGMFGLTVQQFLPHLLTQRIASEVSYDQIPHLCAVLQRRADALAETVTAGEVQGTFVRYQASQVGVGALLQFQQFYEKQVRPYLGLNEAATSLLQSPLRAEQAFERLRALPGLVNARAALAELQRLCDERRQLREQERLHHWLHTWLLIHIPAAILLLLLGLAHAVSALYY
jgi:hypothetical protein